MKLRILLLFLGLLLAAPASFASFPVPRPATTTVSADMVEEVPLSSPAAQGAKSQGVALILWIFLGFLAGHRWYLGSPWYWNLLYIVTLGGAFVWAIIDLIDIITGKYPAKGGFKGEFW